MADRNKKNRSFPFAAVLLLIILIAGLFIILRSCQDKDSPAEPSPSATIQASPTPSPKPENSTAPTSPQVTEAPSPSPSPSQEPSPSPTPSPSQAPELPLLTSGTFSSDTGTALNMNVNWSAYSDGDSVVLDIALTLSTYSIKVGSIYNGATITVSGESYTFDTPAIDYEGDTATTISLGAKRFTLPGSGSGVIPVRAVWNFRGSYSGQDFESITAERDVQLG